MAGTAKILGKAEKKTGKWLGAASSGRLVLASAARTACPGAEFATCCEIQPLSDPKPLSLRRPLSGRVLCRHLLLEAAAGAAVF